MGSGGGSEHSSPPVGAACGEARVYRTRTVNPVIYAVILFM